MTTKVNTMILGQLFAITLILAFVHGSNSKDKEFFLQKTSDDNEILLVETRKEKDGETHVACDLFYYKHQKDEASKPLKSSSVQTISEEELMKHLWDCDTIKYPVDRSAPPNTMPSSDTPTPSNSDSGKQDIGAVFPGTKWCGPGDIAKDYNDLGVFKDTDLCCRAHDNCNDSIAPGETKHNLTNMSPITKLNCKCDEELRNCFQHVDTVVSNTVGVLYFDVLMNECFQKDYPKKCVEYIIWPTICLKYEKDTSGKKVYQFVPAKPYVPGLNP